MIGLFSDKTYSKMTNYDDGDKDRNGDENEERNDDNNVASGS